MAEFKRFSSPDEPFDQVMADGLDGFVAAMSDNSYFLEFARLKPEHLATMLILSMEQARHAAVAMNAAIEITKLVKDKEEISEDLIMELGTSLQRSQSNMSALQVCMREAGGR